MSTRGSIEKCRQVARAKGGECLSIAYVSSQTKLRWRCIKGHEWGAIPASVKFGRWCPYCACRRVWAPGKDEMEAHLDECRELARPHGGKCLSTTYVHSKSKLRWRCKDGHEWEANLNHIKNGHWCPFCSGRFLWAPEETENAARLEECQKVARTRGGECLSTQYERSLSKLRWRCAERHEWEATPNSIQSHGGWCPMCSGGIKEELCRRILERLTGEDWVKVKPKWLLNDRGNRMEIDGFCSTLHVGFEYHGKQHYEAADYYGGDKALRLRQADDIRKLTLCREHGIRLVEVPYSVPMGTLIKFLAHALEHCLEHPVPIPPDIAVDGLGYDRGLLKGLQGLAGSKGGKCMSTSYLGVMAKHRWCCATGHEWEALPNSIQQGSWCPYCAGLRAWVSGKNGQEARQEVYGNLARAKGGECLPLVFGNNKSKLKWRCALRHEWEAKPNSIQQGAWCPYCAGKRVWAPGRTEKEIRMDEYQKLALSRGGELLSQAYLNNYSKLKWRCARGHFWEAKPNDIQQGHWCPYCAGRQAWAPGKEE